MLSLSVGVGGERCPEATGASSVALVGAGSVDRGNEDPKTEARRDDEMAF